MLYFSYVHCVISYGIIFGGNTGNSIKIFRIQKKSSKNYELGKENGFMQRTAVVSLGARGWISLLTERSLDKGSVRTLEK